MSNSQMISFLAIFILLIISASLFVAQPQAPPSQKASSKGPSVVAKTSFGPLLGFVHSLRDGHPVNVFLGVPYAEPPVGALRFEKPIPPQKWEDVHPAVERASACVPHARPLTEEERQKHPPYAEDCLYLDLIAPHKVNSNVSSAHPIMVVIHGGGFEIGSAHQYDFADIGEKFVRRGIVVIVVQHRLGILGFASSGDKTMPGNLGLWDLVAMLRWIRSEAKAFGGDPKKVTLLGFSAGSAAIGALGICPYARELFLQGIQMSGSILAQTKTGAPVVNETKLLAREVNCSTDDPLDLKECLREKTVEELHDAMEILGPSRSDVNFCKFGPRVDGHFFPRDFPELIQETLPKRTLLGFSQLESLAYTLVYGKNITMEQYAVPLDKISTYGEAEFEMFVREVVAKKEYFGEKAEKVQKEIIKYFAKEYDVPKKRDNTFWLHRYSMVLTDLHYIMPCVWESRLKLNLGWPIWLYENAYFEPSNIPKHVKVYAPSHGSDHDLIFANPLKRNRQLNERSQMVARMLVEMYSNFVLKGDPNPPDATVKWKMATQQEPMRHLLIDGPNPRMVQQMDIRRLKFWHKLTETYTEYNLIRGTYGHLPSDDEHDEL